MCSLKVASFTGVQLQVKTFVLYPHHYDHEVLPGELQTFFKALSRKSYYQLQLSVKARLLILHQPNRIFYLSTIYFFTRQMESDRSISFMPPTDHD